MTIIYVTNENLESSIKAMWSQTFDTSEYIILWDKLWKENKDLLEKIDIPKTNLTILTKNDDKVPKKFYHQTKVENFKIEEDIKIALRMLFKSGNREEARKELNKFKSRHILRWLETTSTFYPDLAIKMVRIQKYVYSPYFKDILLYELEGMNCVPMFYKRR